MIKTGNNRGYGNDYHCEFLTKSAYTGNTSNIILVDTSHNKYEIKSETGMDSSLTCTKFGKTSIFVNNSAGGNDFVATAADFRLRKENFCLDYWFAIENNTGTFNSTINWNRILHGTSGFTTAIILTKSSSDGRLPSIPDNHLVLYFEIKGVSRVTGMTYYDLGLISSFSVRTFHHISFNRVGTEIFITYDGKIVAYSQTQTTSHVTATADLFCDSESLDLFGSIIYPTYDTYMSFYIDEFRYSKGIRRYKHFYTTTEPSATQCFENNRAYSYYSGGTGSIPPILISGDRLISAGEKHTVAFYPLKIDMLKAWGYNDYGQLGDYTKTNRLSPVTVQYTIWKSHKNVDCYGNHSAAISIDNKIWLWGDNQYGQLGNNTTSNKSTPISLATTFNKMSTGRYHTLALNENGIPYAWGRGTQGRLGDGTISCRSVPTAVCFSTKAYCEISAGNDHSLAIDTDGRAWGWGNNFYGYLGNNQSLETRCVPVSVHQGTKTFCAICAGENFSLSLDNHGQAWGWGYNKYGQLGLGVAGYCSCYCVPVSVIQGSVVKSVFVKISGKFSHSLAIDNLGMIWSWGLNDKGQMGTNTLTDIWSPISIHGIKKTFCHISAGERHSVAIDKNEFVWVWGLKEYLGINWKFCIPNPVDGNPKTFCAISCGPFHSLAITDKGKIWAWGSNAFGALGVGLAQSQVAYYLTPISICQGTKTFCHISSGDYRSFGIDRYGLVWSWGYGEYGALGNNSTGDKCTPVSIHGVKKTFCSIISGADFNLVLSNHKEVWGWGYGGASGHPHPLGDLPGTLVCMTTPYKIASLSGSFNYISAGFYHSMALDINGQCWSWGSNNYGELGINSTDNQYIPQCVIQSNNIFCQIFAAGQSSFAIAEDEQLWAWGLNTDGQLGDGTTSSKKKPVLIGASMAWKSVVCSGSHTLGLDISGKLFAWGDNTYGQLGDDSVVNRLIPVSVKGKQKTFCEIGAGRDFSVAVDNHGKTWSWGIGDGTPYYGQNGQVDYYKTPVKINDFI